jgi:predicted DNA-binding transcriptional regulator YafY
VIERLEQSEADLNDLNGWNYLNKFFFVIVTRSVTDQRYAAKRSNSLTVRKGRSRETFPMKDGRLRMILKVADTDELIGWILSFGSQLRVVRPEGLFVKVKDEAKKISRA